MNEQYKNLELVFYVLHQKGGEKGQVVAVGEVSKKKRKKDGGRWNTSLHHSYFAPSFP